MFRGGVIIGGRLLNLATTSAIPTREARNPASTSYPGHNFSSTHLCPPPTLGPNPNTPSRHTSSALKVTSREKGLVRRRALELTNRRAARLIFPLPFKNLNYGSISTS
ncbi:hypothetical protein AVEN_259869-1 [Araneus ventricosus]|uniref:Uncharacterized protein n=1 Tax=Araneus ventricosus TaxID=182803 RepID=A0A4Y2DSN4_ARAVE|nr:hypothetical protein AVEN_259869-1 [Araneus ventricosus]